MSDDDSPNNVFHMPRIGSPPPPPVPPPPALDEPLTAPDTAPGTVRISAFDAPAVPHAPSAPSSVPAALRSDGLDPAVPDATGLPPRTGALSLAAILAIALAAFEGLQTWLQELGPRRAEAAKHTREVELLAAKARADAVRLGAEADKETARARRVPSSHEYGRSALGRGSGGAGRGGGGLGSGRSGTGRTGPYSGSAQQRSQGLGGRSSGGGGRSAVGRGAAGAHGGGSGSAGTGRHGGAGSRNGTGPGRNGGSPDRNGGLWRRNGPTGSGAGGGTGGKGAGGSGGARGGGSSGGSGRRSPRQAVTDWWGKGRRTHDGSGSGAWPRGKSSGGAAGPKPPRSGTAGPKRSGGGKGSRHSGGPTFWDDLKNRVMKGGCVKPRRSVKDAPRNTGGPGGSAADGTRGPAGEGDRVHLKDALFETINGRWEKRRDTWDGDGRRRDRPKAAAGGRKPHGQQPPSDAADDWSEEKLNDHFRQTREAWEQGEQFWYQPRASPFDQGTEGPVTVTVEQVDPPGAHAKRWEPDAIGPAPKPLPAQSQPALPRAPQRPAGQRPGTTRRKESIPMATSARASTAPAPVTASVPAPGGMAAQHATDITLNDALKALTRLTTAGMETHDDCAQLARQARRLLGVLETMAGDLATTHNVNGRRTIRALSVLMESVGELVVQAERMARAALDAAEVAEAEEVAMARDYRPTQAAAAEAGLVAPSARIHNEN